MKRSGSLFSKYQSSVITESLMRKNHRSSQSHFQSKAKQKLSKESQPISKQQTYSENLLKNGKKSCNTDSEQERPSMFTEVWPSPEPSPSETTTSIKNVQKSSELDTPHTSMLARYVDRFRHGQPQSREERQQKASNDKEEQLPFWWTSSSLPHNLTPEESKHRLPCHSLASSRGSINMSDTSQSEFFESEILQLQEKASRLLQKGEFCLEEDSLPVSSDGVECSDFSSQVSADEPVRRPIISSLRQCNNAKDSSPVIPSLVAPIHPEEDILFQWRLRRKMEKAREWTQAQKHFNLQDLHPARPIMTLQTNHPPDLSHGTKHQQIRDPPLSTSVQQTQATSTAATRTTCVDASGSLVSPPKALAYVPSHMHLLCDILPCSNQHSHLCEDSVPQRLDSHVAILPQTTQNSKTKFMSLPKTLKTGIAEKDSKLFNSKSTVAPKKQPEKSEKNASILSKQQKKLPRVHSRQEISTNTTASTQQHKQKYTDVDKKNSNDGPPPSPIHSTLGQIVSEVLFPSMDSTLVHEVSPASSCPISAPQLESHKSGEVISQLLQEAEDSDEKEFEDDPLLEVLRKQRKWIKEQINEVDTLLKEFPESHKI